MAGPTVPAALRPRATGVTQGEPWKLEYQTFFPLSLPFFFKRLYICGGESAERHHMQFQLGRRFMAPYFRRSQSLDHHFAQRRLLLSVLSDMAYQAQGIA